MPTIFNLIGPLANPAPIENMLVGVRDASVAQMMAEALRTRGVKNAWLVHGDGGLDEIAISGPSVVISLQSEKIDSFVVDPVALRIRTAPLSSIRGGSPAENADIVRRTFAGEDGPVRDIVSLNAAAALCVAGVATDLSEGLEMARKSLDSGAASAALQGFVECSNS